MTTWNTSIDDLLTAQQMMVNSTNHPGSKHGHNSPDKDSKKKHTMVSQSSTPSDINSVTNPPHDQKVQIDQDSMNLKELINQLKENDAEIQNLKQSQYQRLVSNSKSSGSRSFPQFQALPHF